jgi:hypothetical protein
VGTPAGKTPLGTPKLRREGNIKVDFRKWRGGGHRQDLSGSG